MFLLDQTYKKANLFLNLPHHFKLSRTLEIQFKTLLGIPVRYNSPARIILETIILSNLASQNQKADGSRVLFVGCDWYTKHYQKEYFKKWEYWTIDPNISKKQYGSNKHIIGHLELLGRRFRSDYFDLIICNGVIGYGLNQLSQAEEAFDSCFSCLRVGGKLIIGREDDPTFIPFSNDQLKSLKKFVPYFFQPLGSTNYSTKPRYDYNFSFFEKPLENQSVKPHPQNAHHPSRQTSVLNAITY